MATLSDHQESEHFTYDRSWDEIEKMLYKAEKEKNMWESKYYDLMQINATRKEKIKAMTRTLNVLKEQYYEPNNDFKTNLELTQSYETIKKILEKLKKLEHETTTT